MCIPRLIMPQIDIADIEGLLKHLSEHHGITTHTIHLPIGALRMEQCLHDTRSASNPLLRSKPLMVASDYKVVDGNGRYLMWLKEGPLDVPCLYLDKPFTHATLAMLTYPKVYRLGDGPQPYRI